MFALIFVENHLNVIVVAYVDIVRRVIAFSPDRLKFNVLGVRIRGLDLERIFDHLPPVELGDRGQVLVHEYLLEHELDLRVVRSVGELNRVYELEDLLEVLRLARAVLLRACAVLVLSDVLKMLREAESRVELLKFTVDKENHNVDHADDVITT